VSGTLRQRTSRMSDWKFYKIDPGWYQATNSSNWWVYNPNLQKWLEDNEECERYLEEPVSQLEVLVITGTEGPPNSEWDIEAKD